MGANGWKSDCAWFNMSDFKAVLDNGTLGLPPPTALPGDDTAIPHFVIVNNTFDLSSLTDEEMIFNYCLFWAWCIVKKFCHTVLLPPLHPPADPRHCEGDHFGHSVSSHSNVDPISHREAKCSGHGANSVMSVARVRDSRWSTMLIVNKMGPSHELTSFILIPI